MIKHNYHSHTTFCNHASQTTSELIELAFKNGYKSFGISEHAHNEKAKGQYRIHDEETAKNYINEVNVLKIKYKGKMEIRCGFEVEPMNYIDSREHTNFLVNLENMPGVDYMIIGNHYYTGGGDKMWVQSFYHPTEQQAKDYIFYLEEVIKKCKKVLYIAHPDVFYAKEQIWNERLEFIKNEIYRISKQYDVPLGINVNALCEGKFHPIQQFWNDAAKYGCKATIELDAHDARPFEHKYIEMAFDIAKKANIQLVENVYDHHFKK